MGVEFWEPLLFSIGTGTEHSETEVVDNISF